MIPDACVTTNGGRSNPGSVPGFIAVGVEWSGGYRESLAIPLQSDPAGWWGCEAPYAPTLRANGFYGATNHAVVG